MMTMCTTLLSVKWLSKVGSSVNLPPSPAVKKALQYLQQCVDNPSCFPEVILLDINMPELDGWQFLEQFTPIRQKAPHPVEIYLVSSSVDARDIQKAHEHPEVKSYIIKPLTRENLGHIIDEAAG